MTEQEKQALTASYFAKSAKEDSHSKLETMVIRIVRKYAHFAENSYDYFFDEAIDTFLDCLEKYNPTTEKSSFDCFLRNCVNKRMCSTATMLMAQKRRTQLCAESTDCTTEDDPEKYERMMPRYDSAEDEYFEEFLPENVQNYINSLPKKQKEIAQMIIDGYDQQCIMNAFGLDYKGYEMTLRLMGDFKRVMFLMAKEN